MFDLKFLNPLTEVPCFITGVDEVGRGPLAGPVVAAGACVEILKYDQEELENLFTTFLDFGVTDSKKLNAKKRLSILESFDIIDLKSHSIYEIIISKNIKIKIYIQEIQAPTIDEMNILQASLLAMQTAAQKICPSDKRGVILIDGNKKFKWKPANTQVESIVKGDSKSLVIGLASIVAKEFRDQLMTRFAQTYPEYGWEKNSGYPTKAHLMAILEHGVTGLHRISFKGAKEVYEARGISRGESLREISY